MVHDRDPAAAAVRAIRSLRVTLGWSQAELSRRSRISKSMISRMERGLAVGLAFDAVSRALDAMGARLIVTVDAPLLIAPSRQKDPAHARMSGYVVAHLRRAGWHTMTEVEVGGDRSRGWIDVLAFEPERRALLVIELKTEIHDLGQIERTLGWYEREAWSAARRSGWRPSTARGWLLLLATEANDTRIAENRISIDTGFPLRSRHLVAILEGRPASPPRAAASPRSIRDRADGHGAGPFGSMAAGQGHPTRTIGTSCADSSCHARVNEARRPLVDEAAGVAHAAWAADANDAAALR